MNCLLNNKIKLTQAGEILLGLLISLTLISCNNKNKQQLQNKNAQEIIVKDNTTKEEKKPFSVENKEPIALVENKKEQVSEIKIADEQKTTTTEEQENIEIIKVKSLPEETKIIKENKQTIVEEKKSENSTKIQEKQSYNQERRNKMEIILSSTLGTIFYTITVFVAGALLGAPLWNWVSAKLPWNK